MVKKGSKHTAEAKAKMSMNHSGRLGTKHSIETIKVMSRRSRGDNSASFKGYVYATDLRTGKQLGPFAGKMAIQAAGFNTASVYSCINGKRKTHRGYIWERREEESWAK